MDIIQEYAKAGYALFPLEGKKPAESFDWRLTEVNPNLCRADVLGNYGVVIGSDKLILDVDCKNNAPGKTSFKKLTYDLELPVGWDEKTFVVKTGSGGFHVYLKAPKDIALRYRHPDYPGIDFLRGSRYVVGPGSIHPDTQEAYRVVFGHPGELLDAPPALLTLLSRKLRPVVLGEHPEDDFVDDDPVNVERFKELLATMPVVVKGQGQTNSLYIVACRARDFGLSKTKALEVILPYYNQVKLDPPADEKEVEHQVFSAYKYAESKPGHLNAAAIFKTVSVGDKIDFTAEAYDCSAEGKILKTLNNCVNYVGTLAPLAEVFRFNTFTNTIEVSSRAPWFKERGAKGPNLCDEDIILLKYFLSRVVKVEFNVATVLEAITVMGHKLHYHPVRNYLSSVKWDGVARLNTWLSTYGHAIDTEYTRAIGRKTLCAAVRRIFYPGCKWDYVLVIEGSQGIGKSTACRILGRSWSGDMNLDPHNKDSVSMMLGKWVIELSEMTALKWADAAALKSFITREKDTARLVYERHSKDFPRQSIFIGTVNPEHVGYLNDITGNRRYWIVKFVGQVDLVALENDADQLWAEATAVYENEKLYLDGEAERIQVLEAQTRMPEDPMRNNVRKWVRENPEINDTTTDQVLEYLGIPMKSINRGDQNRIAQALVELGWVKTIVREGGSFSTLYTRPLRDRINQLMQGL